MGASDLTELSSLVPACLPLVQYVRDINETNKLGTGGELARVFAKLIHDMWSGYHDKVRGQRRRGGAGCSRSAAE